MVSKQPIFPQRVRHVPKQFSWLDHRLVRNHYIEQCSHPAATLYLFLVIVCDNMGLSYYGDDSIMNRLSMDGITLEKARDNLIQINLIAWQKPLCQVLSLDNSNNPSHDPSWIPPCLWGIFSNRQSEEPND